MRNLFEIKAGSGLKGACIATVFQIQIVFNSLIQYESATFITSVADPDPATRFQSSGIGFDVRNLFEIKAGSGLKGACIATVFQIQIVFNSLIQYESATFITSVADPATRFQSSGIGFDGKFFSKGSRIRIKRSVLCYSVSDRSRLYSIH